MDILIKAVIAFISALGFSIMFNLPRKLLFHAGVTGSLAFVTYTIVMNYSGDYIIASLLGSVVVGVMGQIFASITKHPSTLFTVPGIIPLVPGYALYNAMFYLVNENSSEAGAYGIKAVFISIAIACGIAISTTLMLRLKPSLNKLFKVKMAK